MLKSSFITTFSFGFEASLDSVRGRRRSAMTDVMPGEASARDRTSPPMKPLAPVMMSFMIIVLLELILGKMR